MKKSEIIITSIITFMGGLLIICILGIALSFVITKDLVNKVNILEKENGVLEQEKKALKWELEQVDQIICVNEVTE